MLPRYRALLRGQRPGGRRSPDTAYVAGSPRRQGFTLVELLIVIVVIAILAAITLLSYNGVTKNADIAAMKSELSQDAEAENVYQVSNGEYSCSLSATGMKAGSNRNFDCGLTADGSGFCLSESNNNGGYYVTNSGTPAEGHCSNGRGVSGKPAGPPMLSIFAGNGSLGAPTPGPATSSKLYSPEGIAVDASGNIYIADAGNNVVEKVTSSGTLSIFAGNGSQGAPTPGPATSSKLYSPHGVAVDSSGNVYIADEDNNVVEKVTPSGTLSIFAGNGSQGAPTPGPATSSKLYFPFGVAVDSSGNVYIADYGNDIVEKVTPSGTLNIFAGTGSLGAPTPGPATSSKLFSPYDIALDSSGNVYIADHNNYLVEKVTPSGTLSIFAGTGSLGAPTPGPATSSKIKGASGVAVDSSGDVYIADEVDYLVEKVTPSGTLSIFAGTGDYGTPTPGPATDSKLKGPDGVAVDSSGNVYIAEKNNNVVEKVTP